MSIYALLAEALRYPAPGRIEILEAGLLEIPSSAAKRDLTNFVENVQALSLAEWEELYTHTFDLNPTTAPYIAYHIWGDSYKRGAFMAKVNRELQILNIEKDGELPDHLVPLLRYLDVIAPGDSTPPSDLMEIFEPGIEKMRKVLRKEEPDNPYLYLFGAILQGPQLERN